MVRLPQNNKFDREVIVERWMLAVFRDGGLDRFDSLHVDRIDPNWKLRNCWVDAGVQAYQLTVKVRDRHRLEVSVVLAFSLVAGNSPTGLNFRTADQLEQNLNWTPPALYLFRPGQEFWAQTGTTNDGKVLARDLMVAQIDPRDLFPDGRFGTSWFMEFKAVDSVEYSRSVFFAE